MFMFLFNRSVNTRMDKGEQGEQLEEWSQQRGQRKRQQDTKKVTSQERNSGQMDEQETLKKHFKMNAQKLR